jgi:hypothetical protein
MTTELVRYEEGDGGIDPMLAGALIRAIVECPSFSTACALCQVSEASVKSMLQRGTQSGAPKSLQEFSRAMAVADATNARRHQTLAQELLQANQVGAAKTVLDIIAARWPSNGDIMSILGGAKKTESLDARIANPSPALVALFRKSLKKPNAVWRTMLEETGWARAPKPEASG